jgi:hypothetical protein
VIWGLKRTQKEWKKEVDEEEQLRKVFEISRLEEKEVIRRL